MAPSRLLPVIAACIVAFAPHAIAVAQQESVRPGINDSCRDPDLQAFVERFETESREVYADREAIVEGFGSVRPVASDVEAPRPGAKVIFDVTAETKEGAPNKGLDRAAKLLNLYGLAGARASDVSIAIVLHGGATRSALSDDATKRLDLGESNPDLKLIEKLRAVGVEVLVCGQSLAEKGYSPEDVSPHVVVAFSAMTTVVNRQADGYSYVPVP